MADGTTTHDDSARPGTSLPTEIEAAVGADTGAIGPYRLLQRIAEGGMGEVWLAEQKQPVRRRVALKLVKAGMDSREVMLRFASERQALALMDHPAIATVYDAGSTPQGKPYFVMEYVPGIPITEFCAHHRLSIADRLRLFVHVCEGVQHAHQKAIIHRDLKPSNILVIEVDGKPAPKIIDFGVAKAVSQRLIEQTVFTRVGSIIGTPEYMSPEQAGSGGEDIDTRSDIYSLGVILYELLAGVPPIELKAASYLEFVRKLQETETPKPSSRRRSGNTAGGETAKRGDAEVALLARELRGDLDCITLKCLEKDRKRRYASPSELAADIERYLNHQPVLARPASAAYRFGKFVQRNRGLAIAVCALVLALVAGTVISVYQAVLARRAQRAAIVERDRADAEAATAAAVNEFLQNDLLSQAAADQQAGGETAPDPDVKVRTLVDRAAAAVSKKFSNRPMVEADLHKTLGETYLSLGLLKEAGEQMRRSYELNARSRGASARTVEALIGMGTVDFSTGNYAQSTEDDERAYEMATKALGPTADLTLQAMQSLAVTYTMVGQNARAEPLLKNVLGLQIKKLGYDNAQTLDTSDSLAFVYMGDGRYTEARKLLERGLQSYKKLYGPEHPNTQREIFGLARVLLNAGDYAGAERLARSVYDSNVRLLGPSHFKTLQTTFILARAYRDQGKLREAQDLMSRSAARSAATLGEDNETTLDAKNLLATIYERQNQYGRAEELLAYVESRADKVYGAGNPNAFDARQQLGRNLLRQRECERALPLLTEANRRWESFTDRNWRRFEAQALLGEAAGCENHFEEAERLLLKGYRGLEESAGQMAADNQSVIKEAAGELAQLYTRWNKPAEAEQWRLRAK